jgi:hypothetical protein
VTCLYCGISRQCFYKWLRRYEELAEEGLRDGSSALLNRPKPTKPEVVSPIVHLRSHYYFGPRAPMCWMNFASTWTRWRRPGTSIFRVIDDFTRDPGETLQTSQGPEAVNW